MSEQLPNSIQKIRELTPKLNQSIDQANRVVAAVEKFLNDENAGAMEAVNAWSTDQRELYLACKRIGDKFRIAVGEMLLVLGDDGVEITDEYGHPKFRENWVKTWSECN